MRHGWIEQQALINSLPPLFVLIFYKGTYCKVNHHRFLRNTKDDIHRELALTRTKDTSERVQWLNHLINNFWIILDPVMSAYIMENMDTYLVDYLPAFLDSVRLTTFTLGTIPFRIESVTMLPSAHANTICMDWWVAFTPDDMSNMTQNEIYHRINPKVALSIRLGKGLLGTAFSVLVEDMSFRGHLRVKIKMTSKFPHVQSVEACFMSKPQFDYVLKPLGGDTFGFDVNNIPGLQGFVRDQVHAILGPMMYYPNVFAFDVEKFFSGELDITQANGVLAVTVHSCSSISSGDGSLNPYVRLFLNKAQELGRTSVREDTLQPIWNETHFLLLNNLHSILTLELRSHNTNAKDKRIARANFDLVSLEEEEEKAMQKIDLVLLRHGKTIGDLKVDMRYMPVSKPVIQGDGTIEPAIESNSGILRFTVHECRNIGASKVSPYARVMINGVEKMKTPVFKRTPHPKFERPGEVVVLDKTEVNVRIEIKDSISFAEDAILGVWTGYLVDIMQEQEHSSYWWDLKNGAKEGGRLRFSVQWKSVVMTELSGATYGQGYSEMPLGLVRLSLWQATDLRNVEAATGSKSDPYIRVMSGTQIRARTEVVDNNLNPEWGEFCYIPIHSIKEDLVLEAMDWNAKTKDKNLGSTLLRMKDLIKQCKKEDGDISQIWYEPAVKRLESNTKSKGTLVYSAEFFPTLSLPKASPPRTPITETPITEDLETRETPHLLHVEIPERDLNGVLINYTPDDMIDLNSYTSGIVMVRIHEVRMNRVVDAYCQLLVDSIMPQFKTSKKSGDILIFNESVDAFVKESDFSRVTIEIKPADSDEKDDIKLGYWVDTVSVILRRIQNRRRKWKQQEEEQEDGEWFHLLGTDVPGQIRLSFDYTPLPNLTLSPEESLENQGNLTVTLVSAKNLMAGGKSGTSDPYVQFTVNGKRVYKSAVAKKTINPTWNNEQFTVPILSRIITSFRIEVFDSKTFTPDALLGSGGISISEGSVESFVARNADIPLDGVAGVTGSVCVRFLWQPQLLTRKKTHTSVLGTARTMTSQSILQSNTRTIGERARSILSYENQVFESTDHQPIHNNPPLSATETMDYNYQDSDSNRGMEGSILVHIIEARGLRGVDNQPTIINFKVKDHNRFAHSIELGECQWNIWSLISPPQSIASDMWLSLYPTGSGEIHVAIEFS
ncbi:C2 domain-containing protein [Spinellus fusiger]|nr:C2 domain-containing protein [Spinellus fusiger]